MKKKVLFWMLLFPMILGTAGVSAQVTIGKNKTPENYSLLELISNGKNALRLPQLTSAERDALTVSGDTLAEGLIIFNKETRCIEYWDSLAWVPHCAPVVLSLDGGVIFGPGGSAGINETSGEINFAVLPSGGILPYTARWQYCLSDCNNNEANWYSTADLCPDVDSTLIRTYKPCGLSNTTEFRRKITDADGAVTVSNAVPFLINLVAGMIDQPNVLLPIGGGSITITGGSSTGGRNTTHYHLWEYCKTGCSDNINWYNVTDNTGGYTCANPSDGLNYTTCLITDDMRFRRRDMDGEQYDVSDRVLVQLQSNNQRATAGDIEIATTSAPVCQGGTVTITPSIHILSSLPSPQNLRFILYEVGSNIILGENNISPYTFTVNPQTAPITNYAVSLVADNIAGNMAIDRKLVPITVTAKLTPEVSISADTTSVYAEETVTFTATSNVGNGTYQWQDNGSIVGTNSSTYAASWTNDNIGAHNITCIVTPSDTCVTAATDTSNTVQVTVNYLYHQHSCDDCKKFLAEIMGVSVTDYPYYSMDNTNCYAFPSLAPTPITIIIGQRFVWNQALRRWIPNGTFGTAPTLTGCDGTNTWNVGER